MTTFDQREDLFEKKFSHDAEMEFKATARRNKLLGLWLAEKIGLPQQDARAYAQEVVKADFEAPGDQDVIAKLLRDAHEKGLSLEEKDLRTQMDVFFAQALREITQES